MAIIAAATGALLVVMAATQSLADATGVVCVTDGNTISVNGKRHGRRCHGGTPVRLLGIDAPELKQVCKHSNGRDFQCGRFAASFLLDLVKGKQVFCKGDSRDKSRRWLAICYINGNDLNALMVGEGWALADRRFSEKYIALEAAAERGDKGLWSMEFTPPWEWRKTH